MNLVLAAVTVFLLNIPFGYWRNNVKKFSLQWVLAIHIPVPFVVLLRIYGGIGFEFITYPIIIGAFFLGQLTGAYIYNKRRSLNKAALSSCLIMDLIKSRA
jgi:hypothetical protein